ncbi:20217_t:CDS:1, partial [Racocetra persica]
TEHLSSNCAKQNNKYQSGELYPLALPILEDRHQLVIQIANFCEVKKDI